MTTERMALIAKLTRFWAALQLAGMMIAFYYAVTLDGNWQIINAMAVGVIAVGFTNTIIRAATLHTIHVAKVELDKRIGQ